jgi:hypothetical protein
MTKCASGWSGRNNAADAHSLDASSLNDLKIISSHIERQCTLATANHVCRIIYDAIQTLRRFPDSGKIGIEEGTRELVVSKLPIYIVA